MMDGVSPPFAQAPRRFGRQDRCPRPGHRVNVDDSYKETNSPNAAYVQPEKKQAVLAT
jgi:hypothetical protein